MSITRNWVGDEAAQETLQTAYENDELRALRVVFPSGNGFYVLVEVRQSSWSAATSSVVGATYSLRVRGKPDITPFVVDFNVTFHQRLSVWFRH